MSPSIRDNTPLAASTHSKIAAPAITGNSKRSVRISMARGSINALRPSTNSMLTTLVPAMLPTASAPLPSDAANDTHGKFRHAGADRHHRQADDDWADPE